MNGDQPLPTPCVSGRSPTEILALRRRLLEACSSRDSLQGLLREVEGPQRLLDDFQTVSGWRLAARCISFSHRYSITGQIPRKRRVIPATEHAWSKLSSIRQSHAGHSLQRYRSLKLRGIRIRSTSVLLVKSTRDVQRIERLPSKSSKCAREI